MTQLEKWRDKYLDSLDKQEYLENLTAAQADMLRRVVINLSATSAGLDQELDAVLLGLKEKLRGAPGAAVHDQVVLLESVVRRVEERRQGRLNELGYQLKNVVANLQSLSVPQGIAENLEDFTRKLNKPIENVYVFAEFLKTAAELQHQAIKAAQKPPQSLWQRLKGGVELQRPGVDESDLPPAREAEGGSGQELGDDSWQELDEEIQTRLRGILEGMSEQERSGDLWQRARQRVEQGMDWQQLLSTLEDIEEILSGRDLSLDRAISSYLAQVNQELHDICDQLGLDLLNHQTQEDAAQLFGQAVSNQVAHLQSSLDNAGSLEELKSDIRQQISLIQRSIDKFQAQREEAKPVSEELQQLLERIKAVEAEAARTQSLLAEERHKAHHDSLTELPNRESYNQRALQEWQRFRRYGRPLSMAVVDIDHFKQLNDQFGHRVGDRVLRLVAQSLAKRLRSVDFIARYGGEEFVILFPETSLNDAIQVMESARKAFASTSFRFKTKPVTITFSCGVSEFCSGDTIDVVFERADAALYQAKRDGRNRTLSIAG